MKKLTISCLLVLGLFLLSTMVLAGCGTQEPPAPPDENDEPQVTQTEILLYFADDQAEYLIGEQRIITGEEPLEGEALASTIIEELIQGPEQEGLGATIPEGTRLLDLEIEDGLARVNFSAEIKSRHVGGSAGETMTLTSIVNSLTEMEEIDTVQIYIEGAIEDTLAGHWFIGEPLERNPDIIK